MIVRFALCTGLAALLFLGGCGGSRESEAQRHREANTPAGKFGKVAHAVAKESGKAAGFAARKLDKAAHDAHEGWKEAARNDQDKKSK